MLSNNRGKTEYLAYPSFITPGKEYCTIKTSHTPYGQTHESAPTPRLRGVGAKSAVRRQNPILKRITGDPGARCESNNLNFKETKMTYIRLVTLEKPDCC